MPASNDIEPAVADPPLSRRAAATRTRLIEAATRCFGRSGLEKATMEDVATEAGVAASSLYRYFSTKRDLYDVAIEFIADAALAPFEDPLPSRLPFLARFEWVIRRQITLVENHREFFMVFTANSTLFVNDTDASDPIYLAYERWLGAIEDMLADGAAEGEVRSDISPSEMSSFIGGAFTSLLTQQLHGRTPRPLEDSVLTMLDLLFHGVGVPRESTP